MDFSLNEITIRHSIKTPRKDLFDLTTKEGNYWIGFLLADGHINVEEPKNSSLGYPQDSTKDGALEFYQAMKNKDNVLNFVQYAKKPRSKVNKTSSASKNGYLAYVPKNPDLKRIINQFNWKSDMKHDQKLGRALRYLRRLESPLAKAFICGFIDGDGSIHKKKENCTIELKSNWSEMLKMIQEKLSLEDRKLSFRPDKDSAYITIPKIVMKDLKNNMKGLRISKKWDLVNETFDFDTDSSYDLDNSIDNIAFQHKVIEKLIQDNISKPEIILDDRINVPKAVSGFLQDICWFAQVFTYGSINEKTITIYFDGIKIPNSDIRIGNIFGSSEFAKEVCYKALDKLCLDEDARNEVEAFFDSLKRDSLNEVLDFDNDSDYELGQPIIDKYKDIQTLTTLISEFVYSHYPNNDNIVSPGVVLDSFIWRFFPYYYNNDDDFIEGYCHEYGDHCKLSIIHSGDNFERYERKRIRLDFPKKSTRKSFIKESAKKMAEGLVESGIDMKHLNIEQTNLSEAFDFDDSSYELDAAISDAKKIVILSNRIDGIIEGIEERLEEFDESEIDSRSFIDNILFTLFSFHEDEEYDFTSMYKNGNNIISIYAKENPSIKYRISMPESIKPSLAKTKYSKEIAKAIIKIGLVDEVLDSMGLLEAFDFNSNEYEQDFDDKISKMKKFYEWNFHNGFKFLESFYSKSIEEIPDKKIFSEISIKLLINLLYPKDSRDSRDVELTNTDCFPLEDDEVGLYFRNNHTGKAVFKAFPEKYTLDEFKNKWAYDIIDALEKINAPKSNVMKKASLNSMFESFDFDLDDVFDASLSKQISEIALIRKIIESVESSAKDLFQGYFGKNNWKEMYMLSAYNVYLDPIKDRVHEKTGKWFGIGTRWIRNTSTNHI